MQLLEFSVKNFFSFKEGASVSFRLDANCPEHISKGLSFTPVLCVKGANASGKTHLLKAIAFLFDFCMRSFSADPEKAIKIEPFFDSTEPCEFSVVFAINNILYEYELLVTDTEVLSEKLYRTKAKRTKLIERVGVDLVFKTKEFNRLATMKLRRNASIVSTARQYEFEELKSVYRFFSSCYTNVNYQGLRERPIAISKVCEMLKKNQELFDFVKSFISECDTGISDIKIIEETNEGDDKKTTYLPLFFHTKDGKEYSVTDTTESSGTKALFRNLILYKAALEKGGLLVLDEFDINLHPHILPKLINLFLDPTINTRQAQIIFTTHNSDIMDSLGRYRTYLVNKEDNESYAYRLDEVPGNILRNDRSISPIYNDGKIGGVPRL